MPELFYVTYTELAESIGAATGIVWHKEAATSSRLDRDMVQYEVDGDAEKADPAFIAHMLYQDSGIQHDNTPPEAWLHYLAMKEIISLGFYTLIPD